ncbi:MAG: tRNA 2-thiouridine(34) synthase MnmA [Candidatus Margulisiibacteriota bacterium]
MKTKKRVVLGMSGGVDSSVAAALLKKRGYDVIGITLQLLPKENETHGSCCNLNAIGDAKRVAYSLGIPHYTVNARETFEKNVISDFVSQYVSGYTPNPCVECNKYIKFDEMRQKALELDADFIATGHYIQRRYNPFSKSFDLKKAKDPAKDQSYFLYMLTDEQLRYTLFPLGGFLKSEIRKMAEDFKLVTAKKAESQEICFVTKDTYKNFIESRLNGEVIEPGPIVDTSGKLLGMHKGIYHYTIGQRKGLGIAAPEPLFVLKINPADNSIVVGKRGDMASKTVFLRRFSQVNASEAIIGKTFDVKTRYQMTPCQGRIVGIEGDTATLELDHAQEFISPGQSGVLYAKDRVVGGGIILSA